MIELSFTILIIGIGLGFWAGNAIENRRWRNELIARRISTIRH